MWCKSLFIHSAVLSLVGTAGLALATETPFLACQTILEPEVRLNCFDAAAAASTRPSPPAASPAPEAQSLFGLPPEAVQRVAEKELGLASVDSLTAAVTAVRVLPSGKLEIELDNSQQWRQIDNDRMRIAVGETVRIRRAALGSYLLQRTAGGRGIRVRRII